MPGIDKSFSASHEAVARKEYVRNWRQSKDGEQQQSERKAQLSRVLEGFCTCIDDSVLLTIHRCLGRLMYLVYICGFTGI